MNYDKKTIRDIDVSGKKILLRCDFNVPHDKATGVIHDDTRIVSTLPTIRYLLAQEDVDGGLIGGASLDPDKFLQIIHTANQD